MSPARLGVESNVPANGRAGRGECRSGSAQTQMVGWVHVGGKQCRAGRQTRKRPGWGGVLAVNATPAWPGCRRLAWPTPHVRAPRMMPGVRICCAPGRNSYVHVPLLAGTCRAIVTCGVIFPGRGCQHGRLLLGNQ